MVRLFGNFGGGRDRIWREIDGELPFAPSTRSGGTGAIGGALVVIPQRE